MKNICIIQGAKELRPDWASMNKILTEFDWLVSHFKGDKKLFYLNENGELGEDLGEFYDFCNQETDVIFYGTLDFSPFLKQVLGNISILCRLIFPIFGDLITRLDRWTSYQNYLKDRRTHFICASHATVNQLDKLFINPSYSIIPYSIHEKWFEGLPPFKAKKKPSFIYFGRVNVSKGGIDLINLFSSSILKNYKLTIIGEINRFDDRVFGNYLNEALLEKKFNKLPENITYINWCHDDGVLINHIDNAHCFVSLSRFCDEDFGLAVAESIARNKDLILTNWGGYRDYADFTPHMIELDRAEYPYQVKYNDAVKTVLKYIKNFENHQGKKVKNSERYSRKNVLLAWEECINKGSFSKYEISPFYEEVASSAKFNDRRIFNDSSSKDLELFKKIYFDY